MKVKNQSFISYATPAKADKKVTSKAPDAKSADKAARSTAPLRPGSDDRFTTMAVGEEGGTRPPPDMTTMAVGEEGGTKPPPDMTTKAIGEEGGTKPPPDMTTMAVGEEGGTRPPVVTTRAIGEEGGTATTLAIGEEGGSNVPPSRATASSTAAGVKAGAKNTKAGARFSIDVSPVIYRLAAGTKHVGELKAKFDGRSVSVKVKPGATAAQLGRDLAKAIRAEFKNRVDVEVSFKGKGAAHAEVDVRRA